MINLRATADVVVVAKSWAVSLDIPADRIQMRADNKLIRLDVKPETGTRMLFKVRLPAAPQRRMLRIIHPGLSAVEIERRRHAAGNVWDTRIYATLAQWLEFLKRESDYVQTR